jgi:GntR family transcriptional regulator, carbon starvation induced regulator
MTLADTAYRNLRGDIVSGALAPGSPLRLSGLSGRYGIGFSPLREALNRLQGERLVVSESLRGFRVAPLSLDAMRDTIRTRILIESEALRLAIAQGDDAWEAAIVASLHALTRQAGRTRDLHGDGFAALEDRHHAFHRALLDACGSAWLMDFAESLYVGSERYRHPAFLAVEGDTRRDIGAEHAALAEAALARDAARACALLDAHYSRTAAFIETVMAGTRAPALRLEEKVS